MLIFLPCSISAQNFRGKVIDHQNKPVPFAAIYVRELMRGFTADENGNFHAPLEIGEYSCEISSMGYKPKILNIQITNQTHHHEILLEEQIYTLKEVNISKKAEDPAYAVMRNTIASAPFNLNRIDGYKAEMYLKGSGKMEKIPGILKINKGIREDARKYMNKLFLLEEQREIVFRAPDHWEANVIAYSNTFPDEVRVEIGLSMINLYKPELFGRISPVNPSAFSYYKFKLDEIGRAHV